MTVLGKAAWMSRNKAEAIFPTLQASLTLVVIKCIASVVHYLGLPLNWVEGSRLCFSVINDKSVVIKVEKCFLIFSSSPIRQ